MLLRKTPDLGTYGFLPVSCQRSTKYVSTTSSRLQNETDGGDSVLLPRSHLSRYLLVHSLAKVSLTEEQLDNFRQEVDGAGIPSYPHPKLMPEFWQVPHCIYGFSPISAIQPKRASSVP
ncbi:hypothetical protein O9992_06020 [Vibrio lentus]|nr:hypothetical protein [Vibrio lentus]